MSERAPAVPGFELLRPLGQGATGEVWLAEDGATGEQVALKRVRPAADGPQARARMRREAAVLAQVRHEHLLRLRALHTLPDGLVLVLDHAPGGSLADLVHERGPLTPGELVTVAAPLAEALAHVHAHGIVHGDVSPANILLTDDGRPLLADLGVARLLGEPLGELEGTEGFTDPAVLAGAAPSVTADVYALGAVCRWAAGAGLEDSGSGPGQLPEDLLAVITGALAPDPADRPHAAELAARLFESCRPAPLRLSERPAPAQRAVASTEDQPHGRRRARSADADREPSSLADLLRSGGGEAAPPPPRLEAVTHRVRRAVALAPPAASHHRFPARAVLVGLVAALVLGLAAGLGIVWAGAGSGPDPVPAAVAAPRPSAVPSPTAPPALARPTGEEDWRAVLGELYARRSLAFATGSTVTLRQVYAPGSVDLARNTALLDQLRAAGAVTPDVRLDVVSAELVSAGGGPERVVLDVVDALRDYTLTDDAGSPLAIRAGRGEQSVRVELVPDRDGWLIASTQQAA